MKLVRDMYFPDADMHMTKEYEKGHTQLDVFDTACKKVTDFSCAVDGGAHVGIWTLAMADRFAEVHAFEPARDTFNCLTKNVHNLIDTVYSYNFALSEKLGQFDLAQDERWDRNTGGRYLVSGTSIKALMLDMLDLYGLGLIKLDVEGHELYALKGAAKIIKRCSPVIICEEKPKQMERQNVRSGQILDYLKQFGYHKYKQIRRDVIYVKE